MQNKQHLGYLPLVSQEEKCVYFRQSLANIRAKQLGQRIKIKNISYANQLIKNSLVTFQSSSAQ